MTDYVGFSYLTDFSCTLRTGSVVYLSKHNDSQTGNTICAAVWKDAENDVVYYFRAIADHRDMSPTEFHEAFAASKGNQEKECSVRQDLLVRIEEVLEFVVEESGLDVVLRTGGVFSFPTALDPAPVLVSQTVFEDDAKEIMASIEAWIAEQEK